VNLKVLGELEGFPRLLVKVIDRGHQMLPSFPVGEYERSYRRLTAGAKHGRGPAANTDKIDKKPELLSGF